MMERPDTVLVLGAGASEPFGFPVGSGLRTNILNITEESTEESRLIVRAVFGGTGIGEGVRNDDQKKVAEFGRLFRESARTSIDEFLKTVEDPNLEAIGKAAIAFNILKEEKAEKLFSKVDWYHSLLASIAPAGPFDKIDTERFSVLTFNYDRSLEQFLFTAMKANWPARSDEEIAEKIERIGIFHLHGSLGGLPWSVRGEEEESVGYELDPTDPSNIDRAARGIRLAHQTESDAVVEKARQLLRGCARILFLGFGYLPENIRLLSLDSILNERRNEVQRATLRVTGSVFGLGDALVRKASSMIPGLNRGVGGSLRKHNARAFLEEVEPL